MLSLVLALVMSVSVPFKAEPHTVRVRVLTDTAPLALQIELVQINEEEEEGYYRRTIQDADPGKSGYWFFFRDVPSGHYKVLSKVQYQDGHTQVSNLQEFFVQ